MAATPQFIKTPVIGSAAIATANTNLDGTGTMAVLATGSSKGTVIRRVVAIAAGTVTDGFIRLFIHDGSSSRFYAQLPVAAATPSATVAAWQGEIELFDCVLPSGYSLRAATYKSESFAVHAFGGDL
jgi:hypothetical protein